MLSQQMSCIECTGFGAAEVMRLASRPIPVAGEGEVLIKVKSAGINRADLLQRQGKYPPPAGVSDILGLEVSGTIAALGTDTKRWKVGDKVCALLSGGGYAQYVAALETHCLSVPENIDLGEAAGLIEAVTTVYTNLFESSAVQKGETVLVHGGSSGIGTMAVQMLKTAGAKVFVTVSSEEKAGFCRKLGADLEINYKQEDFVEAVKKATDGRGVDIVLDMVGGSYINRNLQILAFKGRHVSIATQSGAMAEIDVRLVMHKQLALTGSTLRSRDKAEKARLIGEIEAKIWPQLTQGKIKPVIFQAFPLKNVIEAHKILESGAHRGKIILEVS